jgi:mRNA interferase RelE/StbE
MKKYQLRFAPGVLRSIDRLPGHIRQRVKRTIDSLRDEPIPKQALALKNRLTGYYRIRVDEYRIIYTVQDEIVTLEIAKVAKRDNDTYEDLPIIE